MNRPSTDFVTLSRHFGHAYGKLPPFSSHLAQQARYAIAFKMNWFREHRKIPGSSLFFLNWHFFSRTYEDIKENGFHSELLKAIKFYGVAESRYDSTIFVSKQIN